MRECEREREHGDRFMKADGEKQKSWVLDKSCQDQLMYEWKEKTHKIRNARKRSADF